MLRWSDCSPYHVLCKGIASFGSAATATRTIMRCVPKATACLYLYVVTCLICDDRHRRPRFAILIPQEGIICATGLLEYQGQAEPLAHHAGKEAAHRVLLPAGCLDDGRDGCTLLALEYLNHTGLFRSSCGPICRLLRGLVLRLAALTRREGRWDARSPPSWVWCDFRAFRSASTPIAARDFFGSCPA